MKFLMSRIENLTLHVKILITGVKNPVPALEFLTIKAEISTQMTQRRAKTMFRCVEKMQSILSGGISNVAVHWSKPMRHSLRKDLKKLGESRSSYISIIE